MYIIIKSLHKKVILLDLLIIFNINNFNSTFNSTFSFSFSLSLSVCMYMC